MILPAAIFNQHIIVLGKTRAGKSYALRGMVERLLDEGHRVCVVDPKGDWWGLKSSADGKSPGYPVVIFGGAHADIPLNQHVGSQVAELIATGNRPSILDFGGWMVGERTRFWIDFAAGLFRFNQGPIYLLIDEIHNFAPKGKILDVDAGKCLHWTNRLASEGAGRGIILIGASQRPAKVHNDTLTSCETLIAKRVIHPSDREALSEWIDGCGDPSQAAEVLKEIATIDRTEGWVWSPEIGFGPKRITFPTIKTFDSFAASANAGQKQLKGWAEVDLDDVKQKLSSVVEQAKANDPTELKKQIAALKKEKSELEKSRTKIKPVETVKEKPVLAEKDFVKWVKAANTVIEVAKEISRGMAILGEMNTSLVEQLKASMASSHSKSQGLSKLISSSTSRRQSHHQPRPVRPVRESNGAAFEGQIPIGERKILEALIQYTDGRKRSQLTVLTGYKRSSRDTYIARLREKSLVDTEGENVFATPEGLSALPDAKPLPTGVELQEMHLQKLPQGERAILEVLIAEYPNAVSRETLSERTNYLRSSRDTYIARMRAKEIITEPSRGEVRASDTLFE